MPRTRHCLVTDVSHRFDLFLGKRYKLFKVTFARKTSQGRYRHYLVDTLAGKICDFYSPMTQWNLYEGVKSSLSQEEKMNYALRSVTWCDVASIHPPFPGNPKHPWPFMNMPEVK